MDFRYIAIEGPPGVGKTPLAERLAGRLDGSTVLEDSQNPFLEPFRRGRPGAAFQAQMFFLLNRYRELSELAQRELFEQLKISDFILARDKIYAYLHLDDTELSLYEKMYRVLGGEVPAPDLVVYLQAPADVLLKRLRKRAHGTPFEESDLKELVRAYDYFFFHYSATPLLVVNSTNVDFADPDTPLDDLVQEIHVIAGGTRYYIPGVS